jgi:hypothetical protein
VAQPAGQSTDPLREAAFGTSPEADAFAMAAALPPARWPVGTLHRAPAAAVSQASVLGSWPAVWAASRDALLRAHWLAAVVLGGQGYYAAAAAPLRAVLASRRPLWASLAASTLASHRRQLGLHAAARPLDSLALRLAAGAPASTAGSDGDGLDAAGARCDALTGLAADALGLGRLDASARLLAAAGRAGGGSWRADVRLGWVRAELALASGRADAAVVPARDALQRSAGSVRHEVKSAMVLGVALATAGDTHRAEALLRDSATRAEQHRLLPLRWATELVLGDLHIGTSPGESHRSVALRALRLALSRAEVPLSTAAESSLWVLSGVLHSGDSAERSSAGEIHDEICTGLCQVSTPRDR